MKLARCPVCNGELAVSQVKCENCSLKMKGNFEICEFCQLSDESLNFLRSFIKCRGVIKDMEKDLGISYPTVRSRLDKLLAELGYEAEIKSVDEKRYDVLEAVKEGKVSTKEAIEALKNIR